MKNFNAGHEENRNVFRCLNESKGRKHPKISDKLRNKLFNFFYFENEYFYRQGLPSTIFRKFWVRGKFPVLPWSSNQKIKCHISAYTQPTNLIFGIAKDADNIKCVGCV